MVLKNPPNDAALLEGMRSVAAEQWSWGEQAARKWLEENAAD
jgi:hypothetical protein